MGKRKALRLALQLLVIALVALALSTYWDYRQDLSVARKRVHTDAQLVETAAGPIEYATGGDGAPVLVVHGSGGGFDQGAAVARWLLGDAYQWIAPSRFGYLGTPLPDDASIAAQADAHAALLDALGIERAAVVGISAGGPSSLQFALRHPDRCSALIMVSAFSRMSQPTSSSDRRAFDLLFRSDLLYWLTMKGSRSRLAAMTGAPPGVADRLAPEEEVLLTEILGSLLPVTIRRAGLRNDTAVFSSPMEADLGRIAAPTLVIHAADDAIAPLAEGQYTFQMIPGARLITLPDGGHLLMGHHDTVRADIVAFLGEHASGGAEE